MARKIWYATWNELRSENDSCHFVNKRFYALAAFGGRDRIEPRRAHNELTNSETSKCYRAFIWVASIAPFLLPKSSQKPMGGAIWSEKYDMLPGMNSDVKTIPATLWTNAFMSAWNFPREYLSQCLTLFLSRLFIMSILEAFLSVSSDESICYFLRICSVQHLLLL